MNNNIQTYPTCDHHRVLINFIAHLAEQTFTGRFHKNHYVLENEIGIISQDMNSSVSHRNHTFKSTIVRHLLNIPFLCKHL